MKIITIMPVRNEGWIIKHNLTILSQFCDHILIAIGESNDKTFEICSSFPKVLMVPDIEPGFVKKYNRRKILLDKAREFDGLNLILALDADELVTADAVSSPAWFNLISNIKPGESYHLPWIWIWKSPRHFRHNDKSAWSERWIYCLFRDDRINNYSLGNWHEERIPSVYVKTSKPFPDVKILHYAQVAKNRVRSRQCYCQVIELLKFNRSPAIINENYIITKDERSIRLSKIPFEWLSAWERLGVDVDNLSDPELSWFDIDILKIFSKEGTWRFADLDIWDINWEYKRQLAINEGISNLSNKRILDPRNWEQRIYHEYLHKHITTPYWRWDIRMLVKKIAKMLGLQKSFFLKRKIPTTLRQFIFLKYYAKKIPGARLFYRVFSFCAKRVLHGLVFISVRNYRLPKHITPEYLLSIPTVHTVGDSLLHFHYTRLSAEEQKRPVLCLTPDAFPSNIYVRFIFNQDQYIFYSEPLYNFLVLFSNRSYVNHIILEILKKRFKKLKPLIFYQKD